MIDKADVHKLLVEKLYSKPILNNTHRGDFVEMMVLSALSPDWKHVGLGWNLWDLQRGNGANRVRIQVKQCAALQLWGKTKRMILQFPWRDGVPGYIRRDFPNEDLEDKGRFCELFVVGVHEEKDAKVCDQTEVNQWRFMVIPASELKQGQSSMAFDSAKERWPLNAWPKLKAVVDERVDALGKRGNCDPEA